ncbi:unnamed protein product [Urochloa humidicola]
MEGSGGNPPTEPPPADKDAKRARKRSRYLSPPYTDTDVQEVVVEVAGEEEEEEEPPPNVSAAEALSALGAAALWGEGQDQGVDPAALRFLALYRKRNRATTGTFGDSRPAAATGCSHNGGSKKPPSPASAAASAGGDHTMLNLSPAALRFLARAAAGDGSHDGGSKKPPSPASAAAASRGVRRTMLNFSAGPAMPGPGPRDGSPALALAKKRKNSNADGPMQNAGALGQATAAAGGHIWATQWPDFTVNAAYGVANPAPPEKKRRRKYKKRMKIAGHEQYHFGNPAALVLDFATGTPLPSKEDLVSTFRRFGLVIDSATTIAQDMRRARVVFATRAEAEAAYSCAGALGTFGPPSVVPSLQDLPPISHSAPPPVPKLPLTDIRSNLEKMIVSLNRRLSSVKATAEAASSPEAHLVREMQGLLAKVDKMLQGRSATAHHGLSSAQ